MVGCPAKHASNVGCIEPTMVIDYRRDEAEVTRSRGVTMTRIRDMQKNKKQLKDLFIEDLGQVTGAGKKPPITTLAIGEEDGATTLAIGEEDGATTLALGEEDPLPTL
jgi:hypothetical protein